MSKQQRRAPAPQAVAPTAQQGPQAEPGHDNSFMQSLMGTGRGEGSPMPGPVAATPAISDEEGATELDASAPEIDVQNEYEAPSGGAARTTVGVKEKSWLQAADGSRGRWRASGGSGSLQDNGLYEWVAPSAPGTVTVTFTAEGGGTSTVTFTVVAPSSLTGTGMSPRSYASGTQGAGMDLTLTMGPTNVSFGNVQWKEISGGPSNVSGYFEGRSGLNHRANPDWVTVGSDNTVGDQAEFYGWPSPWSQGSYTWEIPNKWRPDGSGAGQELLTSSQVMTITGEDGTSTISKLGQSTSRSPS